MAVRALNLNSRAAAVARQLAADADGYGVTVHDVAGACVIDAGVKARGSLQAGMMMARICMADLAQVQWSMVEMGGADDALPAAVAGVLVEVRRPVAACMASQYAGWQVKVDGYFAMGSGPMRAACGEEKLFDEIGHRERGVSEVVGVLEASKLPGEQAVRFIAEKCGVTPGQLTLVVARTASMAGGVQIVARSVETALHKLHALGFALSRVVAGVGEAPLPPVGGNDLEALGRTNDAVLYGSRVVLQVTGDDVSLGEVVGRLPSSSSRDHGRPFGEVFAAYDHDFYRIDPLLFSPACVTLMNIETGRSHHAGAVSRTLLRRSFFGR